ncbi:CHASE2 domain-containing protein [Paraburkholderia sp. FT54]|uniref:CHASE2 domain-containing protein n=1 Tax=Paraburkholderia sp. FT54 TaxID=3074437 RepID=UPI002877FEDB|nr:CHASE2 domain-containing protein [Paraburkholderia sp. FT54]WNC93388.1 CHASE2 domain-containing protein [Paraburkholderia sp. FT54]
MATQNENQGPGTEKHEGFGWWHVLGRAALSVVLGLLLALVVPTRFTEEMGAQTIARYAAPFSGYWFDHERQREIASGPPNEWSDRDITVLVIDSDALEAHGERWPAHYSFYSWLLGYLNKYPPKGLFIDVILSQPAHHESDGCDKAAKSTGVKNAKPCHVVNDSEDIVGFKKALTGLIRNGKPVFLAAFLDEDNNFRTNADLDGDPELSTVKRVGIEFSAHAVDRLAWTYPLVYPKKVHCNEQIRGDAQREECRGEKRNTPATDCVWSAAYSIFKDVYEEGTKLDVPCDKASFMSVTWPLDTAAYGLRWVESDDEESEIRHKYSALRTDTFDQDLQMYCTSSDSELKLLWRAEARAILRLTSRPLCVHYRTIHASQLDHMHDDERDAAFRDRFVMIGTAFAYSNDLVLSPLQDRIPGVFLHAVALDNLLSRHSKLEDIEAWEPALSMDASRWCKLLILGALGFVAMLIIVAGKKKTREKFRKSYRERRHWKTRRSAAFWRAKGATAIFNAVFFAISGLVLVMFGVAMIVIGTWMQVPFLVVAHVLACTIAVEWLDWSEDLFNWITDSKEKSS